MARASRWPPSVYDVGEEPDYRFSFANERTFLAWIRTSLALQAAGVAFDALDLSIPSRAQTVLAVLFVSLGVTTAAAAWWRWSRSEHAMRLAGPLPSFRIGGALAACVVIAAVVLLLVGV